MKITPRNFLKACHRTLKFLVSLILGTSIVAMPFVLVGYLLMTSQWFWAFALTLFFAAILVEVIEFWEFMYGNRGQDQ